MDIESWKIAKKEKKLTYRDISAISKVPLRTVEDIFAGKTLCPRIDTVQAIEKALGINDEQPNYNLSPKKQQLLEILSKIDEKHAEDILEIIKIYLSKDK